MASTPKNCENPQSRKIWDSKRLCHSRNTKRDTVGKYNMISYGIQWFWNIKNTEKLGDSE